MSGTAKTDSPSTSTPKAKRSSIERIVVWGGILVLLAVVGIEALAKQGFTNARDALTKELTESDAKSKGGRLTDADVQRILGNKTPEFSGKIAQLGVASARSYDIFVWRSLLKRGWKAPEQREEIDIHAAYSGQVRPDLQPENIQKLRRNPISREEPAFTDAYVLYVYYSVPDPKTKVRDVVSVRESREPYQYEMNVEPYVYKVTLPDEEGLKIRHESVMAGHKAGMAKRGEPITPENLDKIDPWKNPPAEYLKNQKK